MSTTTALSVPPVPPAPEASPSHPDHHSWIAGAVNGLLEVGVLIVTGGRVKLASKPGETSISATL